MTVRTAQTAKTSHRGSERPAWGRHRVQKDFLSGGSKETGFTEVPIGGTPVTLNVAGIKSIRARTFDQRRDFEFISKIKSAITVRQVGEMYGMEPDRHGMVCCPFHSDSDPSMKLNEAYYYCFGCGANGDAIDLTAKLFDLNPGKPPRSSSMISGLTRTSRPPTPSP